MICKPEGYKIEKFVFRHPFMENWQSKSFPWSSIWFPFHKCASMPLVCKLKTNMKSRLRLKRAIDDKKTFQLYNYYILMQ